MTRICRAKNTFLIAFKSTFTRNRFHGLTSCARRVRSPLFRFAFPYMWLAFREAHSSPWKVEFVYCQAEEFKSKEISFIRYHSHFLPLSGTRNVSWKLVLEGWKVQYFVSLRIWFGFCFIILRIVLQIPLHLLLILIAQISFPGSFIFPVQASQMSWWQIYLHWRCPNLSMYCRRCCLLPPKRALWATMESSLSISHRRFLISSTLFQHLKLNWVWKLRKDKNVKL